MARKGLKGLRERERSIATGLSPVTPSGPFGPWLIRAPRILTRALYVLVVFAPFCALVLQLFADEGASLSWQAVMPDARRRLLLLQSVGLAAGVAASTTVIGLLAALALWQCREGRWGRLKWLALVMAPVPPYIHALAWATALRFFSTGVTGGGPLAFGGWLLAWWVETMAFLPIAAGLCLVGLQAVQPALIESARVLRSDLRILIRIIIPLACPGIFASFVAILLFSLMDPPIQATACPGCGAEVRLDARFCRSCGHPLAN